MQKTIRVTALLLAAAVLCSGCAFGVPEKNAPMTRLIPSAPHTRTLRFIVHTGLGAEALAQADAFADTVSRISRGTMTVAVTTGTPTLSTLTNGESDLLFLQNSELAQANSAFGTLSLPFLYDDGRHMSLALNSKEILGKLNHSMQSSRICLLAAFYSGSLFMVTQKNALFLPADYKDLTVAARESGADQMDAYKALGMRMLPRSAKEIPRLLGEKTGDLPSGTEGKPKEVLIDAVEVDWEQASAMTQDPNTLYLLKTYHTVQPLWFAGNVQMLSSLDEFERAVLNEACAGLLAEWESVYTRREKKMFDQLKKQGVELVELERQQFANVLYDKTATEAGAYQPPSWFDRRIYEIIQSYSTLS